MTKNQAIIDALKSAGYKEIMLKVVPKLFQFSDGTRNSELEFSRNYFDEITVLELQNLMRVKVLPTIMQHLGKRVYVSAPGLSIIPGEHESTD